jgi:hypothetical protein
VLQVWREATTPRCRFSRIDWPFECSQTDALMELRYDYAALTRPLPLATRFVRSSVVLDCMRATGGDLLAIGTTEKGERDDRLWHALMRRSVG